MPPSSGLARAPAQGRREAISAEFAKLSVGVVPVQAARRTGDDLLRSGKHLLRDRKEEADARKHQADRE
ncbi:hypothetical protein ATE48_00960 [Candidatus Viadribacter manganicus]|uniref:Uncharacterized protein n=1 Tax=Candidatus Viadribacter manganicus TaxID=1759059 RepID=A0A1B1ADG5_9PROT|nr:hypothetical protein ATE48_00960 [Candidatus Viadribacter manganicus]